MGSISPPALISGIAHVNLIVPPGTLAAAHEFYGEVMGLHSVPVPTSMQDRLAWFDITPGGQQIHIALGPEEQESSRHPCFKIADADALLKLQTRIFEHYERGGKAAPRTADQPGRENSGMFFHQSDPIQSNPSQRAEPPEGGKRKSQRADARWANYSGSKGPEFPTRFFARDYAGNRLEFSL